MDAAKSPAAADVDKLYGDVRAKFEAAIRLCEVERFDVDALKELMYPLAALADEVFMAIPQYRARWIASPLQLRYFGEVIAGTGFFTRLEKLTDAPKGKERQLESYFVCLALGFKGMYGTGGQSGLRELFENLGAILTDMRGVSVLPNRGNTRKKFLTLRRCLLATFSLLMITAAAVYLSSLVDYLKFLENFL
jgi:type VI secretion system protein ImpK